MPIFHIMTGTTTEVESQLNILKIDYMIKVILKIDYIIKVIGFAATDERHCQILLFATPKQQDEDIMD